MLKYKLNIKKMIVILLNITKNILHKYWLGRLRGSESEGVDLPKIFTLYN